MNSWLIFALIPLILSLGIVPVFAQMESFRITGNPYPEIDSAFNVQIIVQGTSRSSTGYFDVQATIYEKDNPNWLVAAFPKSIYSGTNTAVIDMKQGDKPFKVNVPYILQIQHALMITTFEFTPIEKSSNAPIVKNPYQEIEDIIVENKKLKEELEKKDAIIMEQVRVIQNLAAMMKKIIFEPILNYFSTI
jgi:hypothetical protein